MKNSKPWRFLQPTIHDEFKEGFDGVKHLGTETDAASQVQGQCAPLELLRPWGDWWKPLRDTPWQHHCPAEMECRGRRGACGLSLIPTCTRYWGPCPERHSKIQWFLCSLGTQLCPVKSMNILQFISKVAAAISCTVSDINCFKIHLILSTLTAWLKPMVQTRYLKLVKFWSILMNRGFNECC